MARLTFRKSIKIAPGVRVNVTHRGVRSVSAGAGGLRITQDLHGDRRSGGRIAAAPKPAKPTAAERNAAFEARLSPDGLVRHKQNEALAKWWIAAIVALVMSVPLPIGFLVSLPLLVVAIVKSVNLVKARRQRA